MAGAVTLMFRVFVALVVTLTAVSTALLLSATPVLAQEDPNTTERAPAPSPGRDRSSQPAPDRSSQPAPEPAPTVTVPAPTATVIVPAPTVTVPAPTATVTVPAPTDTTTGQTEPVGDLVNALLVGKGSSGSLQELMEHVADAVDDLVQAIGGMLDGLLGGDDAAPAPVQVDGGLVSMLGDLTRALGEALGSLVGVVPAAAAHYLSAQPLAAFFYGYEQATTELIERSADTVGELAQAAGRMLSGGVAPNQAGVPATPPAAPPPVPVAPPLAPVGYSSSLLVASGSAADAFHLLFAVLALLSVALLKGGRLSWLRRESHAPPMAVVLAIERPG
jgi:hypothetical protein